MRTFGPYLLLERIGLGASTEVYRAVERASARACAVKRLMPSFVGDADLVARLRGEARLLASIRHPGIVRVLGDGEVEGIPFVTYELVSGADLRTLFEAARASEAGRLPAPVSVAIVTEVAAALGHAHERLGLVHRDVSPANVLVGLDGSVKITDFGLVRAWDAQASSPFQVKGSPGYLSPEHVAGEAVGPAGDVFSLGVCLWELLVGRRLFEGSAQDVMRRIATEDVPSAKGSGAPVSEVLDGIVRKALAKRAADRYDTALAFHAELSAVALAEGWRADRKSVAREVRRFSGNVENGAAADAASLEEFQHMADQKGGSDLDVFEGLSRKPSIPPISQVPPSGGRRPSGLMTPLPPPPSGPQTPLPPPPSGRISVTGGPSPSISGLPPMPSNGMRTPLPPPPGQTRIHTPPGGLPLPPPSGRPSQPSAPGLKSPLPPPQGAPITLRGPAPVGQPAAAAPLPPPPKMPASLPVPAQTSPSGAPAKPAMDWDDAEARTSVYEKGEGSSPSLPGAPPAASAPPRSAAATLLASSGGAAAKSIPPAAPVPAVRTHPPPPPVSSAPPRPSAAPPKPLPAPASRRDEATEVRPRPGASSGGASKVGVVLGGLSLVAVLGLGVYTFLPKKGQLRVEVTNRAGVALSQANVYVDGVKRCDTVPCVVQDVEPGKRSIKVVSSEMAQPLMLDEDVKAGKEILIRQQVELGAAPAPSAQPVASKTGLKFGEAQPGVRVFVDGVDKGPPPLTLELTAGSHKVRFDGGERYEQVEQTVDVGSGELKDLGAVKLKVKKGILVLEGATDGATLTLVREGSGKPVKKTVTGPFPRKIEVDASEGSWKLVATKKGHEEFSQAIDFADGNPEMKLTVDLVKEGDAAPAVAVHTPGPATPAAPKPAGDTKPAAAGAEKPADKPAAGTATLNINSIPVSKVVLDGRPLGSTPKIGISVPAGSHTVTFIHPEMGKKSVSVTLKPGETKVAAVKF